MDTFQGTGTEPEAVSGKILLLCWWFFLFFMTRMYGSNLTAFLTVDRLKSSKQHYFRNIYISFKGISRGPEAL